MFFVRFVSGLFFLLCFPFISLKEVGVVVVSFYDTMTTSAGHEAQHQRPSPKYALEPVRESTEIVASKRLRLGP